MASEVGRWLVGRGHLPRGEVRAAVRGLSVAELERARLELSFLVRAAYRRSKRAWLSPAVRGAEAKQFDELTARLRAISDELAQLRG